MNIFSFVFFFAISLAIPLKASNLSQFYSAGGGSNQPYQMIFADTIAPSSTLTTSGVIMVSGFAGPLTASVSGASGSPQITKVGSGSWGATAIVNPGDEIQVRMTSSATPGTVSAVVTIGNSVAKWNLMAPCAASTTVYNTSGSGTYTAVSSCVCTSLQVIAVGGGGGGKGVGSNAGGGGGGGGAATKTLLNATGNFSYTVGAGGTAGASAGGNGGNGGSSTVTGTGIVLIAGGGFGGTAYQSGAVGGVGVGGSLNFSGGNGGPNGGGSAACEIGNGSNGVTWGNTSATASCGNYGGPGGGGAPSDCSTGGAGSNGGGGAGSWCSGNAPGAAGGTGRVIFICN